MQSASERVALVTGASSGIGRSCAARLAARGWRVYEASRTAPLAMDARSDESVRQAVSAVLEREGRIDAVVNSAGIAIGGALEDTSIEEAKQVFEVNVFGVLRVCRAVLPAMRARRAGYIVNIGSIAGLVALPYQSIYSASKFALEGLTESLRMEARGFGIHVVLIEPGDHHTGLTRNRRRAAASTKDSAYHAAAERALARMAHDEQTGPEPDRVARLLERVLDKRDPRLRYTTGPVAERAAAWLKRLGPDSLLEKVVGGYYRRPA